MGGEKEANRLCFGKKIIQMCPPIATWLGWICRRQRRAAGRSVLLGVRLCVCGGGMLGDDAGGLGSRFVRFLAARTLATNCEAESAKDVLGSQETGAGGEGDSMAGERKKIESLNLGKQCEKNIKLRGRVFYPERSRASMNAKYVDDGLRNFNLEWRMANAKMLIML